MINSCKIISRRKKIASMEIMMRRTMIMEMKRRAIRGV